MSDTEDQMNLTPEMAKYIIEQGKRGCDKCDGAGGVKTYANQACMPIHGRVRCIDWCIHQIVAALNAGGVETVASCCGHSKAEGRIDLADGRVLTISNKYLGTPFRR